MRHAYLLYELAWALPVIVLQWAAAWRELRRRRRALALTVVFATAYLGSCDAFALGHGIWRVDPQRVIGVRFGPLPVEELLFYFLTTLMAAQGFILIAGYLREREKRANEGRP